MRSSWLFIEILLVYSTTSSDTSSEVCNSTCEELGDDQPGDVGDVPDASLDNFGKLSPSLYSR